MKRLAACVLVLTSIGVPVARSQVGSGSDDPDDDEGSGSGSAAPNQIVAPPDPTARKIWVQQRMEAAIASRPALARVRFAFAVKDLATNTEIAAKDADGKLNLASNMKLLTSMAALSGLGGGFRWRTAVFAKEKPDDTGLVKGDLFIRGRGDPTLSIAALDQLAADVAAVGVRQIEGKLVIDATYFDAVVEPPHFDEQPKEYAAFRAPVAAFGVNRSALTITVMAEPGGGARVTLDPPTAYAKITKDEVTSVTTGRTRLRVEEKPKRDRVELEITGQIKAGEGSWDLRRRVADPARFAGEVFARALDRHGITVTEKSLAFRALPLTGMKVLAHHDSGPLSDVLRAMNKYSDNYIAESLWKTLGAETKATPGPGTWADAHAALGRELAKHGLPVGSYKAENGSGLFASTEVSSHQLVTLLAAAHADYRYGPDLLGSLPTGGYDGTLARRYHGRSPKGRVHAKTGTLDKVNTLAGYVAVDANHVVAFAILANDIPAGQRPTVRAAIDEMVEIIVAYLGTP